MDKTKRATATEHSTVDRFLAKLGTEDRDKRGETN